MNKSIFLKSTHLLLLCLIFLFTVQARSQCINTIAFTSVTAQNDASPQDIGGCFEANNFSTISGLIPGGDYLFVVSGNNGFGYITITTTDDVVIAHGPSPLTIVDIEETVVRFHVADNAQCVNSGCYFSSLQYLPACPQPTTLNCTAITTTSATANWAAGTANLWDLEYGEQGFAVGSGTLAANLSTNSYSINDLTPGTNYEFYVKAKCTANEQSFWSGPFLFSTTCNTVNEIYENFDTIAPNQLLPNCWSSSPSFTFNIQVIGVSGSPATAPNCLQIFSTDGDAFALLPPIANLNANTHRLRFNAFSNAENTTLDIGYLTNPNDVASFVLLNNIALPFGDASQAEAYTIIPATIPAGITVLAFKYTPNNGFLSSPVFIDDVRWEPNSSCLEPIFASATNITDTSAELFWDPGSSETEWEIQFGLQNFVLGEGITIPNVTNASYTLNFLSQNMNYQYYVRAVCGINERSGWSNPYSFKTDCTAVTEFSENFDTTQAWSGLYPNCWTKAGNSSFNEVIDGSTISGPNYLNLNGEESVVFSYAIMPAVSNLQAGTHRLRFKANSNNPQAILELGYISNVNDLDTYTYLTEFEVGLDSNENNTDLSFNPNLIPSGVKNLVFKNGGIPGASTNVFIDDVKWELIPTCQEPTEINLISTTSSSAIVGWVNNGNASQWEIQYGPAGFSIGEGISVTATNNPHVLNNLTANTLHECYIRSVCSTSNNSSWTGPFKFRTACEEVTEFNENFDSTEAWMSLIPSCWSRASINNFSNAVINNSPMSAPNCLLMDAFSGFNELYTVMPAVSNLQANTHRLKFKALGTGIDSGTLYVGYMTNVNDISTFVTLQEFQIPLSTNILDFFYSPTAIPAGIKNLVFRNSGSANGLLTIRIDDVIWEPKPTIAPNCSNGLTATLDPDCGTAPVTLTWNNAANADAYRITIGTTPGGSDILNNVDVGSNTNYVFESSIAATTYYWSVTPYNAAGNANSCATSNFVTPNGICYCEPEYLANPKSLGDLIANVEIQGTTFANNSGTAPVNPFYTLFIGQPNYTAVLQAGQTYEMTVTVGFSSNQNIAVWIDTNDNGIFESNERVGNTTSAISAETPGIISLKIPCLTTTGIYRMRVRDVWSQQGQNIDPCNQYGFGETEDYYVTITAATIPTTPTGAATQSFNVNEANEATLEDLVVTGANILWFATQADAITGNNPLALDTQISNGSTYYAVSSQGSCLSTALAVTVTVTLGIDDFDTTHLKYYPNPVKDILTISYNNILSEVAVYNLVGQLLVKVQPNATTTQLNLSALKAGTYLVKVTSEEKDKAIKVIINN